jgi:alpha-ribazole phosphatase
MRRSSSMKAGSTAKATCLATAAMSASSPAWRRFCRAKRSGSTSHLARTEQTAQTIFAAGNFEAAPALHQDKDLAEQHLGDWQGLDRHTFLMNRSQEPDSFWYATADERAPNGESFVDLVQRVGAAIERATKKHQGGDIVAVAHGGTIRAAIAIALGLPPRGGFAFMIDNCSLTRLDHYQGPDRSGWRVTAINHRP